MMEPVSENGQKGMDELHEQTVNLLSFQELPKKCFDVQVAFNIVARYGPHSKASLEKVAERIRNITGGSRRALLSLLCRCCRAYAL